MWYLRFYSWKSRAFLLIEATACCRFYKDYHAECLPYSTIEQPLLKWNGHDCDISMHDCHVFLQQPGNKANPHSALEFINWHGIITTVRWLPLSLFILLRVFLVDAGRNVQNGTNFNLTLSVSGLTTSVIFPVIVQSEWCVCVEEVQAELVSGLRDSKACV